MTPRGLKIFLKMFKKELSPESYLLVYRNVLSDVSDFDKFWDAHPVDHHKVKIFGKLIPIPRFQKLYGSGNYNFSGTTSFGDPVIPDFVEKCFEFARVNFPDYNWNGALVNWYADGSHYIGPHSDDEKDLVAGSPILSFSFGAERIFRIKNKKTKDSYDLLTENNSLICMCGLMQKEFTHEIVKTKREVGRRINITIRSFNF